MKETSTGRNKLRDYLDFAGIVSCNVNSYLPCLSDIGCTWQDLTALIDSHELFLCKAYRKHTVYLSREVYFLLKQCRAQKEMDQGALTVYQFMKQAGPSDKKIIKCAMTDHKAFEKSFNFLLENLYITAFKNGVYLNPNWSTFVYATAEDWERGMDAVKTCEKPIERLKLILLRSLPEKEYKKLIR